MMSILPVVLKVLIALGALGIGTVSHYILQLPNDNIVEEVAKEVIKKETGIDVNFSSLDSDDETK